MILRIGSLARVCFTIDPRDVCTGVIFSIRKNQFRYLSASPCSPLEDYPPTSYVSCDEAELCVDDVRKGDLDAVIAKVLAVESGGDVVQSLVNDAECNTIKINHGLVNKLLHRFQDDWKSALGVFRWAEKLPGYKPMPDMYDKLVDILGKSKQMDHMRGLIEEMRENRLVSSNTISKVMRRFAGAGDWKGAAKTFDELENFGLEKNTDSMNLLLDTLCKEGKVDQARRIFMELKSHIPPNANTYNIFIHGWCKIRRVEEAHWTIQEMKGNSFRPCAISYSTIIQFYCSQNNFHKIHELLDEMHAEGCPPTVVTFTTIVHYFTKSGDFNEALKAVEMMKQVGCKPDTLFYNALIHTLGRAGRVEDAVCVFTKDMPQTQLNPNTSTYNTMISMFCHHKQEDRARKYLQSLETSPYCKPDVQSFYPLLKLYLQSKRTSDKCMELLDDMVKKHHLCFDLSTYSLLIHGLCKVDRCEWAYQLFKDMIGQSIKPRYLTCLVLLQEVRLKSMYEEAGVIEEYIRRMKSL